MSLYNFTPILLILYSGLGIAADSGAKSQTTQPKWTSTFESKCPIKDTTGPLRVACLARNRQAILNAKTKCILEPHMLNVCEQANGFDNCPIKSKNCLFSNDESGADLYCENNTTLQLQLSDKKSTVACRKKLFQVSFSCGGTQAEINSCITQYQKSYGRAGCRFPKDSKPDCQSRSSSSGKNPNIDGGLVNHKCTILSENCSSILENSGVVGFKDNQQSQPPCRNGFDYMTSHGNPICIRSADRPIISPANRTPQPQTPKASR